MLEIIQTVDESILLWIQETVRQGWLNPLVEFYTTLGNGGLLWIVLSLALLLGALCTNVVLKNLVQRPRPYTVVEGLIPLLTSGDPNSFPSGHTCAAFAFAAGVWRGTPERWMKWAALALAVFMGLSRLYVGVHYPSDVLVGALVGVLSGQAAWWLCLQWEKRRELRRQAGAPPEQ